MNIIFSFLWLMAVRFTSAEAELRVAFVVLARRTGGGLLLQGRSRTHHAKQLAQHAAAEMSGVMIVANEIKV